MAQSEPKRPKQTGRSGVRGPGGPPPVGPPNPARYGGRTVTPGRARFEDASRPWLLRLRRMPTWLVIIAMGLFLFAGLVLTGPLAWLGGLFLLVTAAFLGWLLALSWPVLTTSSRVLRVVVVGMVVGIAVLKFLGRM
ncbi:MAG: DUF6703 family protein [Candidatus Nanopelagicales bacterium]